jgi:hypothetical protein
MESFSRQVNDLLNALMDDKMQGHKTLKYPSQSRSSRWFPKLAWNRLSLLFDRFPQLSPAIPYSNSATRELGG